MPGTMHCLTSADLQFTDRQNERHSFPQASPAWVGGRGVSVRFWPLTQQKYSFKNILSINWFNQQSINSHYLNSLSLLRQLLRMHRMFCTCFFVCSLSFDQIGWKALWCLTGTSLLGYSLNSIKFHMTLELLLAGVKRYWRRYNQRLWVNLKWCFVYLSDTQNSKIS